MTTLRFIFRHTKSEVQKVWATERTETTEFWGTYSVISVRSVAQAMCSLLVA